MSLLLLLACLCGAAARGAPTAPRCLPESELEGYCRSRRLDGPAPGYKPTKKPSGPAPQCEDFGADVVDTATGEAFCERSGLDDEASCTACGTCCEWDGSRCNYWIERETSSGPNKDCPRTGGAQYVPTYRPTRKPSGECEDDETWEYLAGDKGYKRCDHVAKKPDPRCGRVSDDGVVASVACPETCGTCD